MKSSKFIAVREYGKQFMCQGEKLLWLTNEAINGYSIKLRIHKFSD